MIDIWENINNALEFTVVFHNIIYISELKLSISKFDFFFFTTENNKVREKKQIITKLFVLCISKMIFWYN